MVSGNLCHDLGTTAGLLAAPPPSALRDPVVAYCSLSGFLIEYLAEI